MPLPKLWRSNKKGVKQNVCIYLCFLGLFHRAISMSGSATGGWSFNQNPMYLAQELTKRLGCGETKTSQLVYDCVKDADGQLMANRSNEISVSLC